MPGRQKEKRTTEDEMVGWHHRFNGHEPGQTLGNGEGQGSLVCYRPWGRKEWDTTWHLNNSNRKNELGARTGNRDHGDLASTAA